MARRSDVELSAASWSQSVDGRLANTRLSMSWGWVREASNMSQRRSWPSRAEIRRDDEMEAADVVMAEGYDCDETASLLTRR